MKPHELRERAEECRMTAGMLLGLGTASAISAVCVWYSLGAGIGLLACVVVALVCLLGSLNELLEARRHERRARQHQPLRFEVWGAE